MDQTFDEIVRIVNGPDPEWLKKRDLIRFLSSAVTSEQIDKIQHHIDNATEELESVTQTLFEEGEDELGSELEDASNELSIAWHLLEDLKTEYGN